jgi:REP element-mobilizing transposase RayT
MTLFKNKYRIESNRKPGWDYSSDGKYFLTLVTQHRVCNLGKIVDEKIVLSDFGKIVHQEWLESFEIRQELLLDEWQIMPNHIHAIVIIDQPANPDGSPVNPDGQPVNPDGRPDQLDGNPDQLDGNPDQRDDSPDQRDARPDQRDGSPDQRVGDFYRLPKSISSFIAGFKSAVNTEIDNYIDDNKLKIPKYNRNNHFFQANYHDHIIRNQESYYRIKQYIINNPKNWKGDDLFSD